MNFPNVNESAKCELVRNVSVLILIKVITVQRSLLTLSERCCCEGIRNGNVYPQSQI